MIGEDLLRILTTDIKTKQKKNKNYKTGVAHTDSSSMGTAWELNEAW